MSDVSDAPFTGLAGVATAPGNPALAYQRPSPAASMIVIDSSGKKPRVLMGRRHESHIVLPGRYVFPGGRVDAADRRMNVAGALNEIVEQRLMNRVPRPSALRARAQALAAIRETFEETGLLIGSRDYGTPEAAPEGAWTTYAGHGLYPELDRLHLVARAITPPGRLRRFDTAFFAVGLDAVAGHIEGMSGPDKELVELVWLPLEKAEKLEMASITRTILLEVAQRFEAGMRPFLPVPFYNGYRGTWRRELL